MGAVMNNSILDKIILGAITLFFACFVMIVADGCVLFIGVITTFLLGPQTYIIPLETLMFMVSAVVGITFIMLDRTRV